MRDLYTRALCKISSQDLYESSLQDLLISLDLWDLQDLFKRPRSGSNTQKVPRGLRGRNQNRHRATARAIRHAQTPQRVARAETKKCARLSASDVPSAKWARRYSQSDPTFANIKSAPRRNIAPATKNDDSSPPPISSNPYDDFAHLSKPSRFAHFRISENRHGAQARTHLRNGPRRGPVSRRRNANFRSRGELFTERVVRFPAGADAHHRFTPDAFLLP